MILMESKLLDLFARLSRLSARNRLYAMRARKDNRPQLARLFLALADSQAMQARRFLMQIRGAVGATEENEHTVFATEFPEAISEYQELLAEAEQAGSKALATGFRHSAVVDRLILELYGKVTEPGPETDYYVCDFCGYVATHEPPDNCPICTAPKNRFNRVETG